MSEGAKEVDWLFYAIYWFSVFFFVVITLATIYFVIKYKRKPGQKEEATIDHTKLELLWTITPVAIIVVLFHISFSAYIKNATAAEGAMEIRVRAKRWAWEFEYPNGSRSPGELFLPVNKPVKLVMSSEDVLHSFYVPNFRMKRDTVPGMYTTLNFKPNELGDSQVFCAEYCGAPKVASGQPQQGHFYMLAMIHVVSEDEYKKQVDKMDKMPELCGDKPCTPETWGEQLFAKNGCPTCHSKDGSKGAGPSLKGVFGTMQPTNAGGQMADENYIRESILRPQAKIVTGFENAQMPMFGGLKDPQIDALIAYIKTLK